MADESDLEMRARRPSKLVAVAGVDDDAGRIATLGVRSGQLEDPLGECVAVCRGRLARRTAVFHAIEQAQEMLSEHMTQALADKLRACVPR